MAKLGHSAWWALGAALLCSGLLACTAEVGEPVAVSVQPVVYGDDGRHEPYDEPDATLRTLANQRTLAMLPADVVTHAGWSQEQAPAFGDLAHLCEGERFADQPSVAACTGIAVTAELVLTAGHCLRWMPCEAWVFVQGFHYDEPGGLHPFQEDDLYRCAEVVTSEGGLSAAAAESADYAWIRLDRPLPLDAELLTRDEPLAASEPLVLIGHGAGLPVKIDGGGSVLDPGDHGGPTFLAQVDNFGGGSGSGVFDAEGLLVGVATEGQADFETGPGGCLYSRNISGALGERVTFAQWALADLCGHDAALESCAAVDAARGWPSCQAVLGGRPGGGAWWTWTWSVALLAFARGGLARGKRKRWCVASSASGRCRDRRC